MTLIRGERRSDNRQEGQCWDGEEGKATRRMWGVGSVKNVGCVKGRKGKREDSGDGGRREREVSGERRRSEG